jgi:chromosome segregation ATPase
MSGSIVSVAGRILPVLLLGLIGAGSLSGCSSSCTGDPRTDNYFCAQRNMGAYQNQVNQKQQAAENLQDENVQLQRQNQDLAAQQQGLNKQIDKISGELRSLDTDLNKMNARVQAARSNNAVNQQKLTQASRELQRVQDQTKLAQTDTNAPLAQRQAELDRLKKRYAELEADIDSIMQGH